MDDEQAAPPPWKASRHAAKIESLLLRARYSEADGLIKTAAAEAAADQAGEDES